MQNKKQKTKNYKLNVLNTKTKIYIYGTYMNLMVYIYVYVYIQRQTPKFTLNKRYIY